MRAYVLTYVRELANTRTAAAPSMYEYVPRESPRARSLRLQLVHHNLFDEKRGEKSIVQ